LGLLDVTGMSDPVLYFCI